MLIKVLCFCVFLSLFYVLLGKCAWKSVANFPPSFPPPPAPLDLRMVHDADARLPPCAINNVEQ